MIAYKFLPAARIATLTEGLLRFTPPCDFNDPFEALPRVVGPSRDTMRRQLAPGEDLDTMLARADEFFRRKGPAMVVDEISKTFGALCLAGVSDDPLLWGHYADGHRGFALGFDISHPWFRHSNPLDPILDCVLEVTYQSERPVIQMIDEVDKPNADLRAQARAMLFTKHQSWHYESEWRLVRKLAAASETRPGPNGCMLHLFQYPSEALQEVVLGVRMADQHVKAMRAALIGGRFADVRICKAHISESSYFLDIRDAA